MFRKIALITGFILFIVLSLAMGVLLYTQEDKDPIENPLEEGTYSVAYYQEIVRKTMTGYKLIDESELYKFQKFYKFYNSRDVYSVTIMIERYERDSSGEAFLIRRIMLNRMGNIAYEQTFNFKKEMTGYTLYKYDSLGRLLREAKFDGDGEIITDEWIYYNPDGTLWRKEKYSRGKLLEKEIYGERNKLKKRFLYFYFPDGSMERREEYNGEGVIQKIIIYDYDGSILQKVYYKDGEVDEVVDIKPRDEDDEELSFDVEDENPTYGGKGAGPDILLLVDMFDYIDKYLNSDDEEISINGKTFENNSTDFVFTFLYSIGIDLENEIIQYSEENDKPVNFSKGKINALWEYLIHRGWAYKANYKVRVSKGDLLFFDYVNDTTGDRLFDEKSHIGIVKEITDNSTLIFYHCLENKGNIQIGKVNLERPADKQYNSIIRVINQEYMTSSIISGIGKVDYLTLKSEQNQN
jgi:hypothetical protein